MDIKIRLVRATSLMPKYQSPGAAAFDLCMDGPEPVVLFPKNMLVVPTGLQVEVPFGYVMKVYIRSSLGFRHGVQLANGTGIIDSDYRGEVMLALVNLGPHEVRLLPTERIAQAMVEPAPQWQLTEVSELTPTARGAGGMGSTGQH